MRIDSLKRKRDAAVFRAAARRSLESGDGLDIIAIHRRLDNRFWKIAMTDASRLVEREDFCMALCLLAAVAETGDLR